MIDITASSSSSSSQPRAHRFLQSTRTVQHRESLGAASGSSDSSLPSQKSGVKFGRAARVAALGVAATPPAPQPQAPQRGRLDSRKSQVPPACVIPHGCLKHRSAVSPPHLTYAPIALYHGVWTVTTILQATGTDCYAVYKFWQGSHSFIWAQAAISLHYNPRGEIV